MTSDKDTMKLELNEETAVARTTIISLEIIGR